MREIQEEGEGENNLKPFNYGVLQLLKIDLG